MRKAGFFAQVRTLAVHGLRTDFADRDRLVSPLLFAFTVLLLFSFALGNLPQDLRTKIFVAELFLALFFAIHLVLLRVFTPDAADGAAQVLTLHPIYPSAWYLAKFFQAIIAALLLAIPACALAHVLLQVELIPGSWPMLGMFVVLAICGLAALGVILSLVTLKASGREVIFPLLFFPLAIPVLLSGIEGVLAVVENQGAGISYNWLALLVGFDVIYVTVGLLLFSEALER